MLAIDGQVGIVAKGGVGGWRSGQTGQKGGFGQGDILNRFSKVSLGGLLGAVGGAAVSDFIKVHFEDFVF